MVIRRDVWELGNDWADPILWYARGVKAMKSRPISNPNSWNFYGAIHGFDNRLWSHYGYLTPATELPTRTLIKKYWNECQHGSWYFLPWHRGYLMAFEANIREAIVNLGGPADWALPYWNYFKPHQNALPPAFASPDWPDGKGDNPLFVEQRWGPIGDGNVYVPLDQVSLNAMGEPEFEGAADGGSTGFGGIDTNFEHGGRTHGMLETQPHDYVHGLVGGPDPEDPTGQRNLQGLMAHPDTAGLDPIFWLHHANIDRLWEVWRKSVATHVDPAESNWLKGPASIGERSFSLPMPNAVDWTYTPADMVDLSKLGYGYDDVSSPTATVLLTERLMKRGVNLTREDVIKMTTSKNSELVGANTGTVHLRGESIRTSVQLEPTARNKISTNLFALTEGLKAVTPDRVFLNLENVRGLADSTAFSVYVDLPDGANPVEHPERLAGSIALFGVSKATRTDDEHAGAGLTYVLEISGIVDALHLENKLNAESLDVSIVPVRPVPEAAQVTIGRVSIYRQGN